jgi:hypothetical protein
MHIGHISFVDIYKKYEPLLYNRTQVITLQNMKQLLQTAPLVGHVATLSDEHIYSGLLLSGKCRD